LGKDKPADVIIPRPPRLLLLQAMGHLGPGWHQAQQTRQWQTDWRKGGAGDAGVK